MREDRYEVLRVRFATVLASEHGMFVECMCGAEFGTSTPPTTLPYVALVCPDCGKRYELLVTDKPGNANE